MNQAERDLIANLFSRIRGVEAAPRDPEAEAYISDQVARQPHAPYVMAQTVVVQDEALKAAQARIDALERELSGLRAEAGRTDERSGASPWGPRAQDAMGRGGDDGYGRPDEGYSPPFGAPRSTPGARPTYGSQQGYGAPPPQQPPQQPEPSRGGGFLSGALQTAAGVAAGAMIFQGVRSLFGGDEARAHEGQDAARFGGQESGGDNAGDAPLQGVSDQFSSWFGGGRDADAPEPDHGDDGDDDLDGGGDDRWI